MIPSPGFRSPTRCLLSSEHLCEHTCPHHVHLLANTSKVAHRASDSESHSCNPASSWSLAELESTHVNQSATRQHLKRLPVRNHTQGACVEHPTCGPCIHTGRTRTCNEARLFFFIFLACFFAGSSSNFCGSSAFSGFSACSEICKGEASLHATRIHEGIGNL